MEPQTIKIANLASFIPQSVLRHGYTASGFGAAGLGLLSIPDRGYRIRECSAPFTEQILQTFIRKIVASGEVWGASPRNYFQSDIPKVKAYAGHLPDGVVGFEFETAVEPDKGGVPGKPTWSSNKRRSGVALTGDYARISVKVLKTRLS
jgi:hypothetical protein